MACFGIAFSPDGKILATNGTNRFEWYDQTTVALWDVRTGQLLRTLRLPTRNVRMLQFAPDGGTLLTTGQEPVVRLWDTVTGKERCPFPAAHVDAVESLAFTPDGRFLISASIDRTLRLWDVVSGRHVRELTGHRWGTNAVAVTPDGKAIVSCGSDGCIRVQSLEGKEFQRISIDGPPEERSDPVHQVIALGLTADGKRAASFRWAPKPGETVYEVWDLHTGKALVKHPHNGSGPINPSTRFSPDAQFLVEHVYERIVNAPGPVPAGGPPMGELAQVGVCVRELMTGREVITLRQGQGIQLFTQDGRILVTVESGPQETLHLWELVTGKERLTVPLGPASAGPVRQAAYSDNGHVLAVVRSDDSIQLWDLIAGRQLPFEVKSQSEPQCLTFSPRSTALASAHRDGTILVWDTGLGLHRKQESEQTKSDAPRLEQWWTDLAGQDARLAYAAVCSLSADPRRTVPLFRDRLRPTTVEPAYKLGPLIAELDNAQFERRQAARQGLTALGERAAPGLRAALRDNLSAEQRRSIEQILDSVRGSLSPELLRHLRAVEALERIASQEMRDVLERLGTGSAESRVTIESKRCLIGWHGGRLRRLDRATGFGVATELIAVRLRVGGPHLPKRPRQHCRQPQRHDRCPEFPLRYHVRRTIARPQAFPVFQASAVARAPIRRLRCSGFIDRWARAEVRTALRSETVQSTYAAQAEVVSALRTDTRMALNSQ